MLRVGAAVGGVVSGGEMADEGGSSCAGEEAEASRCAGAGVRGSEVWDAVESRDAGGGGGGTDKMD